MSGAGHPAPDAQEHREDHDWPSEDAGDRDQEGQRDEDEQGNGESVTQRPHSLRVDRTAVGIESLRSEKRSIMHVMSTRETF